MQFTKAHCGGNDFIIIDARTNSIPANLPNWVERLSNRHTGIGADGVIIIEATQPKADEPLAQKSADFGLRFFNPDGSEYGFCGNGSLCVIACIEKSEASFKTKSGLLTGSTTNGKVRVKIPPPKSIKLSFPLTIKKGRDTPWRVPTSDFSFVNIGVPHTILFVPDVDSLNVVELGRFIRYHPHFGNSGTNVNFVQIINKNKITIRTYERGVEGETLSCGSGTCSSAIAGWLKEKLLSPIEVTTRGGTLCVYIGGLEEIWLEGTPEIVYKGETLLEY